MTKEQAVSYNEELSRYVEIDNKVKDANDKLKASFAEAASVLQKYNIVINETSGDLTVGAERFQKMEAAARGADNALSKIEEIQNLGTLSDRSEKEEERLTSLLEDMAGEGSALEVLSSYGDRYQKAIENIRGLSSADVADSAESFNTVTEGLLEVKSSYTEVSNASANFRQSLNDNSVALQAQQEAALNAARSAQTINYQQIVQQIVNITGAVSQMAFAWQSFQNLGSIWADEDITTGEKVYKTFLSLVTTIPQVVSSVKMVISAFNDIDVALTALEKSQKEIAAAESASSAATLLSSTAKGKETTELVKNTVASAANRAEIGKTILTQGASAEMSGVAATAYAAEAAGLYEVGTAAKAASVGISSIPVIGIIAAAISALGLAVGYFSQQAENAHEAIEELGTSSAEESQNIATLKDTFQETYNNYKEGAASSDDLKDAANNLNSAIDDQTAKLAAANGEWETYNKLISDSDGATQTKLNQDARNTEAAFEQAASDYASAPGWVGMGSGTKESIATFRMAVADSDSSLYGNIGNNLLDAYDKASSLTTDSAGNWKFISGTSAQQRINDMESLSQAFSNQLDEISESLSHAQKGSEEYNNLLKTQSTVTDAQQQLQKFRNQYSDKETAYTTARDNAVQNYLNAYKNDEGVKYSADNTKSAEENLEAYNEQIKDFLVTKGLDVASEDAQAIVDAFVQGIAEANPDTQLAKDMGAATSQDVQDAKMGYAQEAYTAEKNKGASEEQANAAADEFYASLSRFTDDEIIELKASIDYATLKENADEIIRRLNDGDDLTDIIADITVDEDSVAQARKKQKTKFRTIPIITITRLQISPLKMEEHLNLTLPQKRLNNIRKHFKGQVVHLRN